MNEQKRELLRVVRAMPGYTPTMPGEQRALKSLVKAGKARVSGSGNDGFASYECTAAGSDYLDKWDKSGW